MNKTLLYGLMATAAIVLPACNESWDTGNDHEGHFSPVVHLDQNPIGQRTNGAPSRAVSVTASDLALQLTSTTGASYQWNSVDQFDPTATFPVGAYTLTATYGKQTDEGFDMPHYTGATQFSIRENETTPVALTATLGNAMVTVTYTEAFSNYFTDYSTDLLTAAGNTITISATETRQPYVATGAVKVNANVTKPGGQKASYLALTFPAEARHHYRLTLDVNNGAVGNATLVVTFDDSMASQEVEIDLSDDLTNTPAPTISAQGFDPSAAIDVVAGNRPSAAALVLLAQGGLASVDLATECTSLIERGWPAKTNLLATTGEERTAMQSLGFDEHGLWQNPDKMAVADFAGAISNIAYIIGGDNTATFTLSVTDRLGQQSDPVTITVNVEQLHFDISNPGTLLAEATTLALDLEYNGASTDDLRFQYQNDRGTWNDATVQSITLRGRSTSIYRVIISGLPALEEIINLRAIHKNGTTSETTLSVGRTEPAHSLAIDERDIFATHATLDVLSTNGDAAYAASTGKLMVSTDGGETFKEYTATAQGTALQIQGLKPSTTYAARLDHEGISSRRVTFTTEADTQIPNGNLDAEATASGSYSPIIFPTWGTANTMTTSQGVNAGYTKPRGTYQTDDAHSGKAAILRTVGWGSGNTNAGAISVIKHISPALLHLGPERTSYDQSNTQITTDDLDPLGIDFKSRPASLKFWYKYTPKNSADKGYVKVWVADNDGNKLCEKTNNLDAQGNYTEYTIALDYALKAPKAAKLYVMFLSTNSDDFLSKSSSNLTWGNPHTGSVLYIDDVTLTY